MTQNFDYVIVGGGIIGLALANELSNIDPAAQIVVIEKEKKLGMHASGRNSGVLHSGVYYGRDTIKAKVCASGNRRMVAFAHENDIPVNQSGKVILANSYEQLETLNMLAKNANDGGVPVEWLDEKQLGEIEPYADYGFGSIYSPNTGVIDPVAVLNKLNEILVRRGVVIKTDCEILDVIGENQLKTTVGKIGYGFLYNCAGAFADKLARKFGVGQDYSLIPFKGTYWRLSSVSSYKVKSNIYPAPDVKMPFLGVHLTRTISGDVYAGPTAMPAFGRENYGLFSDIETFESIDILYRLADLLFNNKNNFRRHVSNELKKYLKYNFLIEVKKLVPSIELDDLVPANKVGIRAQLVNIKTKRLVMDYVLEKKKNTMHVLNSISPAFTSSLEFSKLIVEESGFVN